MSFYISAITSIDLAKAILQRGKYVDRANEPWDRSNTYPQRQIGRKFLSEVISDPEYHHTFTRRVNHLFLAGVAISKRNIKLRVIERYIPVDQLRMYFVEDFYYQHEES